MSLQSNKPRQRFGTPNNVGRGRGMLNPIPFSIDSPVPGVDLPALESISSTNVYDTAGPHVSSPIPHVTTKPY